MADDYVSNLDKTTASNYSMQPGKGEYSRPNKPMDVEDHPAYNVPTATQDHDGTVLGTAAGQSGYQMMRDRMRTGSPFPHNNTQPLK